MPPPATWSRRAEPGSSTPPSPVWPELGISLYGSRILAVRGRRSGEWRTVPVNPLVHDGARYLVAPRGETPVGAEPARRRRWRAAPGAAVRECFRATEVADRDKPPLLRAYLRIWAFEVAAFFDGVGAEAPEEEVRRIAPGHPVFRIEAA